MFELVDNVPQEAVIKVVGVGGGGGNAVCHMLNSQLEGVEFVCANTDSQALKKQHLQAHTHLQLGANITRGLGAGANPEVGREAAMEDRDRISEVLAGSDMVFITAGMGGGTGTGAAPVVAEIAREMGALTVAVVTKPFSFEGRRRMSVAEEGLNQLKESVDSLICIPNENLLPVLGRDVSLLNAFGAANDVLLGAVQGISELITRDGLINVDFADVRTVMSEMGMAMMGTGSATGSNRAIEAAERAIRSPLLEDVNLQGARGVLVNITAGLDLSVGEFHEVGDTVREFASDNATTVVGTVIDPEMTDELRVTVVATGLGEGEDKQEQSLKVVDGSKSKATRPDGTLNLKELDIPPHVRNKAAEQSEVEEVEKPRRQAPSTDNVDYLDIPAFLRRQAD
ncbi:cell division protein FtsZ [Endozoicomonas numazuensis]|uniref:Cell division protein FtsZ n=1 Tax=Endozoicomonas numazuensis TaxID=1137799 RepID=A0A081NE85_9GAMM|nr:cell division protein FtsZ [Endozoicomonas numazuensis]KEQ16758.1 cell division protein FtsZ [Endozoicomonas numazuensis]